MRRMSIIIILPFVIILYFLFWRPQQQRVRRQQELIKAIDVGDRVVTAGGLIGRVIETNDDRMYLEVADGVVVELLRLAVSRRLDEADPGFYGAGLIDDEGLGEEYGEDEAAEEQTGEAEPSEVDGPPDLTGGEVAVVEAGVVTPEPEPAAVVVEPAPPVVPNGIVEEAAAPAPGQDPH